jgi:hypothetical protein
MAALYFRIFQVSTSEFSLVLSLDPLISEENKEDPHQVGGWHRECKYRDVRGGAIADRARGPFPGRRARCFVEPFLPPWYWVA